MMSVIDRADDRGTVTVEAALALCSLVLVLALAFAGISAVAAQLRCVDAAREAARLAARGEADRGQELAGRLAPRGAVVRVSVHGDEVTARVSMDSVTELLPGIEIAAVAVAVLEPGAGLLPGAGLHPGAGLDVGAGP